MHEILDIDKLGCWIGKKETSSDILTPSLEKKFRATLNIEVGEPKCGDLASTGIHWALAPTITKSSELGNDSHARGRFLPPVPLQEECGQDVKQLFYLTSMLEMM